MRLGRPHPETVSARVPTAWASAWKAAGTSSTALRARISGCCASFSVDADIADRGFWWGEGQVLLCCSPFFFSLFFFSLYLYRGGDSFIFCFVFCCVRGVCDVCVNQTDRCRIVERSVVDHTSTWRMARSTRRQIACHRFVSIAHILEFFHTSLPHANGNVPASPTTVFLSVVWAFFDDQPLPQ